MRRLLRGLWLVAVAALLLSGACRAPERAAAPAPSRAELLAFPQPRPGLPIAVGVEGQELGERIVLVPEFPAVEPTPEERKVLGEPRRPPEPDVLVLYRPPPGPQQGVSPESFTLSVTDAGGWGMLVGRTGFAPRYATWGLGGRYAVEYHLERHGARVGLPRGRVSHPGRVFAVQIGEGPPRSEATHAGRLER